MSADLAKLCARLGYQFSDRVLLDRALTHKSAHSDGGASGEVLDNEQFEFLGDSILGFVASEFVFRRCPDSSEGTLSRLKAQRVSATHLHKVACELGLGQYLRLGKGEEQSGGRDKKAILANSVEAIIAAIFLDGGLEPSRRFVEEQILESANDEDLPQTVELDAKSALQEFAQSRKLPVPRYHIVHESGPEHAKTFTVEARVGKPYFARADGASKKAAGQSAAALLLEQLQSLEAVQPEESLTLGEPLPEHQR
jgi:ribonuclease-3